MRGVIDGNVSTVAKQLGVSVDTVTPVAAVKKITSALSVRIERLRLRLLWEAMLYVEVTRNALDQDTQLNEKFVLERASR